MTRIILFIRRMLAKVFQQHQASADPRVIGLSQLSIDKEKIATCVTTFYFHARRRTIRLMDAVKLAVQQEANRFDALAASALARVSRTIRVLIEVISSTRDELLHEERMLETIPRYMTHEGGAHYIPWTTHHKLLAVIGLAGAVFCVLLSMGNLHLFITKHYSVLKRFNEFLWFFCASFPIMTAILIEAIGFLDRWVRISMWTIKWIVLRALLGIPIAIMVLHTMSLAFPVFGVAIHDASTGAFLTFMVLSIEAIAGSICISGFLHLIKIHSVPDNAAETPRYLEQRRKVENIQHRLAKMIGEYEAAIATREAIAKIRESHLNDAAVYAAMHLETVIFMHGGLQS